MNVCVAGLWHLGTVTAACLAGAGHDIVGLDDDAAVVALLEGGRPPIYEPGLEDLVREGLASGRLRFTADRAEALARAEVVWITYDTPVDEEDRADVDVVFEQVSALFPHLRDGALMLISSQLPVGTTRRIELAFAAVATGRVAHFAYSPENLRLGKAIEVFTRPDRVVVGARTDGSRQVIARLLEPITDRVEWMSVESAEMTKHAINAFLATSVTFINELAALCEHVGADAAEVARGLKSEQRIGPRAYLSPGSAFAGGTLARDVAFLSALGPPNEVRTPLLSSIRASNDAHRQWAQRRLRHHLGNLAGKTIAVWGLTYKPDTDTLRRSASVELCRWLRQEGATARAYDPALTTIPADIAKDVSLSRSALAALDDADALVVATPWPEFRGLAASDVIARMLRPLVLDPDRFLAATFGGETAVEYLSVGRV